MLLKCPLNYRHNKYIYKDFKSYAETKNSLHKQRNKLAFL